MHDGGVKPTRKAVLWNILSQTSCFHTQWNLNIGIPLRFDGEDNEDEDEDEDEGEDEDEVQDEEGEEEETWLTHSIQMKSTE